MAVVVEHVTETRGAAAPAEPVAARGTTSETRSAAAAMPRAAAHLVHHRVSIEFEYVLGPEPRQGCRRPYHAAVAMNPQDPVHGVRLVVSLYREFEQVARQGDLSMAQYRTLLYLLGGSRRAGELAAANAVTKPTVSAMINGLRQQGWVADAIGRDR